MRYYALRLASALELDDVWHIETAALLSQMGAVALDPEIDERLVTEERLEAAELRQIEELPASRSSCSRASRASTTSARCSRS